MDFAKRGARVILACRNEEKALKAAQEIIAKTKSDIVVVRILDLASFESVREFAKRINESEDRLDILVNNAGFGGSYRVTKDGYESIFQVNYLSHFLLTMLLLEKLKRSAPSRIVNVSSLMGEKKFAKLQLDNFKQFAKEFNSFTRYAQSKLAQVMFTRELSQRLEGESMYKFHIMLAF